MIKTPLNIPDYHSSKLANTPFEWVATHSKENVIFLYPGRSSFSVRERLLFYRCQLHHFVIFYVKTIWFQFFLHEFSIYNSNILLLIHREVRLRREWSQCSIHNDQDTFKYYFYTRGGRVFLLENDCCSIAVNYITLMSLCMNSRMWSRNPW
jgi:hypothetical protein